MAPFRSRIQCCHRFVAAAIVLGLAKSALAQEAPLEVDARTERFTLAYEAPDECPTLASFSALVRERLSTAWEASPGELARRLEITVSRTTARYLATLEFSTASGERVTRSVRGAVCTDVVNGIALVTALAIRARGEEIFEPEAHSKPETAAPPPEVEGSAEVAPKRAAPSRGRSDTKESPAAALHVRLGARGAIATGVGPGVALGAGLFGALEWSALSIGLSVERVDPGSLRANGTLARFRLLSARLEGCRAFPTGTWSEVEGCAFAEAGSFHAEAELDPPRVLVTKPASVSWIAPGLLGRWLLRLDPVLVELQVLGRFPLRQEKFYVQSEQQVIFRVPAFSAGAALGLGLGF